MNKTAQNAQSDIAPRMLMPPLRAITLVEQIVDAIVRAACEGRFRPGDRVVEAEVARELGVSRVPVREALRLLESQGIVVNVPHSGMRLMDVDAKHLRQILFVRSGLERLAAPAAVLALQHDPAALMNLNICLAAMAEAARRGSNFDVAQADMAFHRSICALSGNQVLLQVWDTLARRLTIIMGLGTREMDFNEVHRAHIALFDMLLRGNPDEINHTLDQHIMEAVGILSLADTE